MRTLQALILKLRRGGGLTADVVCRMTRSYEPAAYVVALQKINQLGTKKALALWELYGSWEAVFQASATDLKQAGLSEQAAHAIATGRDIRSAKQQIDWHRTNNTQPTAYGEKTYPNRLQNLPNPPLVLYHKGALNQLESTPTIGIVGSRQMTSVGQRFLKKFIEELSSYRPTVISGLAYGVDIFAHTEALRLGLPTWAVLAGGCDHVYPACHRSITEKMLAAQGGIISEKPLHIAPLPYFFPIRNRIIAGLSDVVCVIEAAEKSGALLTAEWGNQYGREVYALAGRFDDRMSQGCLRLIHRHQAHILCSADQIAKDMGWLKRFSTVKKDCFDGCTPIELALIEKIKEAPHGPVHIEQLIKVLALSAPECTEALLLLKHKNILTMGPGPFVALSVSFEQRARLNRA